MGGAQGRLRGVREMLERKKEGGRKRGRRGKRVLGLDLKDLGSGAKRRSQAQQRE
jgi:hypothetical protein